MNDRKKRPIYQDDDILTEYLQSHLEPNSFRGDFLMPWLVLRVVKNLERLVAAIEKRDGTQRKGDQQ